MPKANRFVLLMPSGRVGSNLLLSIIDQSEKKMKLANESLNAFDTHEEQIKYLREFYHDTSFQFIGTKQNIRTMKRPQLIKLFLVRNAIKVVRMRRENLLKAAVSYMRAEQYSAMKMAEIGKEIWGVKKGENRLGRTFIDIDVLIETVGNMAKHDLTLMEMFDPSEVLDVDYEEIRSGLGKTVSKVRQYLGISQVPYKLPFAKATPDDLSRAISNFDEVRMVFAGTKWWNMP